MREDGGDDDDAGNNASGSSSFKGQTRSNDTHASRTDDDARLYRKGKTASELRYMGHTLSDNRHGLIANAMVTQADGFAEREAAKVMIRDARQATVSPDVEVTLGADKGTWPRTLPGGAQQCPMPSLRARDMRSRSASASSSSRASAGPRRWAECVR